MKTLLILATLALSGCGAMQQQAIEAAPTKSSYMLCSNLVNATLASNELRNAWADELQRRGENCSQYMPAIAAGQQSSAQAMQLANQLQQPRQAPIPAAMGNLIFQSTSGTTRFCTYDKGGQRATIMVQQLGPCPSNL